MRIEATDQAGCYRIQVQAFLTESEHEAISGLIQRLTKLHSSHSPTYEWANDQFYDSSDDGVTVRKDMVWALP